jgi:tRNA A37 threonylcarbamoyladenosine synthetase subunit TsaC/SUA5/YrdC
MVKINSASRLFTIKKLVILTQTDTTVGLLSQNKRRLQEIKKRPQNQHFIQVFKDFSALSRFGIRVPNTHKSTLRRAKKSTFIVKNVSFRVAKTKLHSKILRDLEWNYSTSANERGKSFQRAFCEENSDIIIEDFHSLFEGSASKLYKINNIKTVRLR